MLESKNNFSLKSREIRSAFGSAEQYRAIGWVKEKLYTLIFEVRADEAGEYYHLVTLWKATKEEQQLYEDHS
jgi:hypothetical protein